MKLSTQGRYGVRAIFDIAYHSNGLETQVKDISRRQEISSRYLEQIFQKLKKAGILGSRRGPSGGYFLVRKPGEITIGDIVRVTENQLALVHCVETREAQNPCSNSGKCVAQVIWGEAGKRLKEYLDSVTIDDLCRMAKEMGVRREADQKLMFYI